MTFRTVFAALVLGLAPTFSLAQGCHDDPKETTAASCIEGHVWDEAKAACVPAPAA